MKKDPFRASAVCNVRVAIELHKSPKPPIHLKRFTRALIFRATCLESRRIQPQANLGADPPRWIASRCHELSLGRELRIMGAAGLLTRDACLAGVHLRTREIPKKTSRHKPFIIHDLQHKTSRPTTPQLQLVRDLLHVRPDQ